VQEKRGKAEERKRKANLFNYVAKEAFCLKSAPVSLRGFHCFQVATAQKQCHLHSEA